MQLTSAERFAILAACEQRIAAFGQSLHPPDATMIVRDFAQFLRSLDHDDAEWLLGLLKP